MPTVSVVVPVLDDAEHLHRCLVALAAQSRPPDEVLVVDNGSSDDGVRIARSLGARVVTEPERGIPRAASRGYDEATGDLIARLDADSTPPTGWLARVVELFDDPSVAAVTGPGRPHGGGPLARAVWDTVYMRPYFVLMWAALARPPLFGSAMAMRRTTWLAVRDRVHRADPEVHDDVDLSMQLDPGARVLADPALEVGVSARPLRSLPSVVRRTRRAFRTFRVNGRRANPVRRWARRIRAAVWRRRWQRR